MKIRVILQKYLYFNLKGFIYLGAQSRKNADILVL